LVSWLGDESLMKGAMTGAVVSEATMGAFVTETPGLVIEASDGSPATGAVVIAAGGLAVFGVTPSLKEDSTGPLIGAVVSEATMGALVTETPGLVTEASDGAPATGAVVVAARGLAVLGDTPSVKEDSTWPLIGAVVSEATMGALVTATPGLVTEASVGAPATGAVVVAARGLAMLGDAVSMVEDCAGAEALPPTQGARFTSTAPLLA
jgi:hypothetical protein